MIKAIAFSKGHISKKIPLDMAATQYLGFASPNSLESPLNTLNPKYWGASLSRNRYGLEKLVWPNYACFSTEASGF